MSRGRLASLARDLDGQLVGADAAYDGVSTDTRALEAGELFVALTGPNFDGADFVAVAEQAGAAGAMVARRVDCALAQVLVDDTRSALGHQARLWRERFDIPVVGLTGSNGKTTVKEMLRAILSTRGPVLATRGNLNNDIGVPLTLLDLDETHRHAVVEMGANHAGEIAGLANLVRPTVGLVNNAGPAHLEGFGSIDGVARAKGELFAALAPDATAVINADDAYCALWQSMTGARTRVLFGRADTADVRLVATAAVADGNATRCTLDVFGERVEATIPLPGEHNARNAAAAAAAAAATGFTAADIATGLEATQGEAGRMRTAIAPGGARIVDDAYNANPESVRAAVGYLATLPGRRWLVLGDMGELGPDAEALHAAIGVCARDAGVDALFATGPLSRAAVDAFGSGGHWHADVAALAADVGERLGAGSADVTVLVKASRSMRLERVVRSLVEAPGADGGEG